MKQTRALFQNLEKSTTDPTESGGASASGENEELWLEVAGALKNLVSGDAYSRWFSSAYLKEVNETEAVLGVVSDMHQVWIETNYLPEVQSALASVSSLPRKVRVVVCEAIQDQLADAATAAADQAVRVVITMAYPSDQTDAQLKRLSVMDLEPGSTQLAG